MQTYHPQPNEIPINQINYICMTNELHDIVTHHSPHHTSAWVLHSSMRRPFADVMNLPHCYH